MVLAILTVQRGRVWASDVSLWEDTVTHAPGKARVWFNLRGGYLELDPDKARGSFLHALELQPSFPEAVYNLGLIEQRKANFPVAVAYYERAIAQQDGYWPAWNNMGNALVSMGESERALRSYERTLNLNPDYWPAQYNLAVVHYKK